ncbi:MAG: hypothetical protein V1914_01575 [archaeon]
MALEEQISKDITCLEATKLLLPYFKIVDMGKEVEAWGIYLNRLDKLLFIYALPEIVSDFFHYELPKMITSPGKWNAERKKWKEIRKEALAKEEEKRQERIDDHIAEQKELNAYGLGSVEERCLYTSLRYTGFRLCEAVSLAEYLGDYRNVTEDTRPDILPVHSEIIGKDNKGRPLEIRLDGTNFATLLRGQVWWASLDVGTNFLMNEAIAEGYSGFGRIMPGFESKAAAALVGELYGCTADGNSAKFLDATYVKRDSEMFYLRRDIQNL